MYYFLANFPKIDYEKINILRKKYDPNFPFLDPHIAIFFPVDSSIGERNLVSHIESILSENDLKQFEVTLYGLEKSWDHYLYLRMSKGKEELIKLHDQMYTKILAPFWIKKAGYIPHLTLGFFAEKQAMFDKSDLNQIIFYKEKFEKALGEAKKLNLKYTFLFNKVSLIRRNDKFSPAIIVKEFIC